VCLLWFVEDVLEGDTQPVHVPHCPVLSADSLPKLSSNGQVSGRGIIVCTVIISIYCIKY